MSYDLRAAIRGVLLPVTASREQQFLDAVEAYLDGIGVAQDKASWVNLQLRRWKRDGSPTASFRAFVRQMLYAEGRDPVTFVFDSVDGPNGPAYLKAAQLASNNFFDLHASLVSSHLLPHDAARQILSHAGMIARLAVEEQMTASEISRLITVRDNRFSLNWRAVQAILSKLGCAPSLSLEQAQQTFQSDSAAEPELLGDLDISGSIERVALIAESLGCKGDFVEWLTDLFVTEFHAPYLLLLHYQLLIQDSFDHAVTYAYEFKPRGQIATWLTQEYIGAGIPVARNAFLNNAKATLRFDQVWVTGRTDSPRSATALANILEAVENMGSLAKDELASQMRGLLHRYLRVESERHGGALPHIVPDLTAVQAEALLKAIGRGNTNSTGILEQRLVDCFGLCKHPEHEWASKGLGDSVFAANTYRRKLGDIEFELPVRPNPRSVSYESHGGHLTEPYVRDHLDSFEYVLGVRQEELETIAPLVGWQFEVVFVAHTFDRNMPTQLEISGCNVVLRYVTFEDAANGLTDVAHLALINENLVAPLNNGFVHPRVRERALAFIR
ncbi:hypothetical protein [Roseovarius mucosus]|uniref:hypothetical protein n=1 Tax=Roseovarius mucosus TaxID=215743 RepID=UPI003BA84506